jgi:tyrosinase
MADRAVADTGSNPRQIYRIRLFRFIPMANPAARHRGVTEDSGPDSVVDFTREEGKCTMKLARRTALKVMSVGAITAFTGRVSLAQQAPRVRRTLTGMSPDDPDLSAYRDFVEIMQGKDQSQPLSWLGFSKQHGNQLGGYKFCPHGDWYFLPWHRAYTLMYEKAVRELTHHPEFAMPYWNWTEMRLMPDAFASPQYKGKPNPLFVPNRNPLVGPYALTDSIVGQTQVIDKIYAETDFELFGTSRNPKQNNLDPSWVPKGGGTQGILERTPHNLVHNNIGVYMPTPASPRDPIFFMHHSNIDRIWAHWNALGRVNTSHTLWRDMPFTDNFFRPDGTPYTAIVRDLQDIVALGYTYDFLPQPDHKSSDPVRERRLLAILHEEAGAEAEGVQRLGEARAAAATVMAPLSLKVTLPNDAFKSMIAPAAGARSAEVYALIRDIAMGEGVRAVRVFVNRPDLSPDVPDTDPHYVTTFSFLDHGSGMANEGGHNAAEGAHKQLPSTIVNLTDTLHRLYGYRRLQTGEITVQLIPVPASGLLLEKVGKVVPASIDIVAL